MTDAGGLRAAAEAGPFFAVDTWRDGAGWRPLRELVDDPAVVAERVGSARAVMAGRTGLALDAIGERPMASIVFLGVAARLLSPAFGALVLTGTVPPLSLATLWWQPVPGGPWPLATSADDAATSSLAVTLSELVAPVLGAFGKRFKLSEKVLWGNVASALGGAVGMLAVHRPDLTEHAGALADEALDLPQLRGTGAFVRPDPASSRRFFVRRSCCLFYRMPGGGLCGDCVLTPDEVRRQQWQAVLSR